MQGRIEVQRAVLLLALAAGVWLALLATFGARDAIAKPLLAPLNTTAVPQPPLGEIQKYIVDDTAAIKLGKALFWDMQAGSDGRTACATCHFDAGADARGANTLGTRDGAFNINGKGPNSTLDAADFPLHKLIDQNAPFNAADPAANIASDTTNVVGSQGVIPSEFNGVTSGDPFDIQTFDPLDASFFVGPTNVRRATGRNTPSVINAVFNYRSFWDGRAQNDFNGVNPFGDRDPYATVGKADPVTGDITQVTVTGLTNSSLASQAVGPPGNPTEMSSNGRTLSDIGQKLLTLRPLDHQKVSSSDSVLGGLVDATGRGLNTSYAALIKAAFRPDWWSSDQSVIAGNGRTYTQMQFNFSLFWGLAIQEYESTLVSDQTPFDTGNMSAAAQRGQGIFTGAGGCTECHNGPTFSVASVDQVVAPFTEPLKNTALIKDQGFFNIGERATADDPGSGGTDPGFAAPFGSGLPDIAPKPLSITRLSGTNPTPDGVDGSFKVPQLRNVALTAPYFHNGGELTLKQVVQFYNRGGDFDNPQKDNAHIIPLNLSDSAMNDVVSFLEDLTDPRVENQSAPFDHPQLFVALGEQTDAAGNVITADGRALDCLREIPATGAAGGTPIARFPALNRSQCNVFPSPPDPPAAPPADPGAGAGDAGTAPVNPISAITPVIPGPPTVTKPVRCIVPKLKGKTIAQARKKAASSHCALGSVVGKSRRSGRFIVVSQSLKPGSHQRVGRRIIVHVRLAGHK